MHTTQLVAPDGFECLIKDEVYHLVTQHHSSGRVLLVHFAMEERGASRTRNGKSRPARTRQRTYLLTMPRDRFEKGLSLGMIKSHPDPCTLPPWLSKLEGFDVEDLDRRRTELMKSRGADERSGASDGAVMSKGFRSHSDRVDEREALVASAFADLIEILRADDPEAELNRYARKCSTPQNETRFRTLFWTKVCFPFSRWALMSPYCRIGQWDRASLEHVEKKLGRPAKSLGKHYGSPGCSPEFIKRITDSYLRHAKQGVPFTEVYRRALVLDFGCCARKTESGIWVLYQPRGEPFPSEHQFRYRVEEAFGRQQMRINVWGHARVRNKVDSSRGRFSQAVANLLEKVSSDVTHCKDVPRGLLQGSQLSPLLKCEIVDDVSSAIFGIGFTLGSEKSRAYRSAQFCAVIGKQKFCRLFGLEIEEEEWPMKGLGPWHQTDRGPGAKGIRGDGAAFVPAIRSIVPSYSPRSNATAESAHKRQFHLEGAPTFTVSRLTPVQMVKGIILETIAQNHKRDVTEKLTPEMLIDGIPGTPMGIWSYLDARMRTCAQQVPFDLAVRTFLEPVELKRADGAVTLHGQRFGSDALFEWLQSTSKESIQGYVLELCTRYVWIETGTGILEVEALLPIRDDEAQYFMSLTELLQLEEMRRQLRTNGVVSSHAVSVGYMRAEVEATGCIGGDVKRKTGRKKPNAQATREATKDFQTI